MCQNIYLIFALDELIYLQMSTKHTFISRKIESGKVCNQMNERDNEYVISCSLVHHTSLECTSSMKIRLRVNVGPCMLVKKALCCMFLWLLIVHLESYDVENCIMWKNTSEITSILSVIKNEFCSFLFC